jgi:hypothetical protein
VLDAQQTPPTVKTRDLTGGVGRKIRGVDNTFWSKKGLTRTTSVSGRKLQNGVCENRRQSWWALGQIASVGARIERNRQQW